MTAEHRVPEHLCLTITFLDQRFHGRRDGGEPEWPPSPLRLFQAIVAAAAAPTGGIDTRTAEALRWFERLSPPRISTPASSLGEPYRLSVPNNAMDLVAGAWARGISEGSGDANPATHRTMKTVRATRMLGGGRVQYAWEIPGSMTGEDRRHAETISAAVRGIIALGWGVDLVVAHGRLVFEDEVALDGDERWEPVAVEDGVPLRVPRPGTFDALGRRHRAFVNRVTSDGFVPVPPLTAFSVVGYREAGSPRRRPAVGFKLLSPSGEAERLAAFAQCRAASIAAMLRHAACRAAEQDRDPTAPPDQMHSEAWGRTRIAGHGPDPSNKRRANNDNSPRLSYLPLPTIDARGVAGAIRRVMVADLTDGDAATVGWASTRLGGAELIDERTRSPVAVLAPLPLGDFVLGRYTGGREGSREWASVTPVILPGYDDGKPAKRERLVLACVERAGLLAAVESVQSRPPSWFPGVASSAEFNDRKEQDGGAFRRRPEYLRHLPAVHVRLRFREPVQGPISLGAGRHCGLGVLAVD